MPRPRTNPDKHRKNVALTIEPDLLMRCRALAAQKGRSLSQLVDQLLREWIFKEGASDSEIEHAIAACKAFTACKLKDNPTPAEYDAHTTP